MNFPTDDEIVEEEAEEGKEDPHKNFNWHSMGGLSDNILMISNEFSLFNELRPVKILISGPPGSGKSYFAKKLSHYYNIPHIHMKETIEHFEKNEFYTEIEEGQEDKYQSIKE